MKALLIGCGHIGSVAAQDLANSNDSFEITVADRNAATARRVADSVKADHIPWLRLDAGDPDELSSTLEHFDLAMGFLPGKLGYLLAQACIKAGIDLIDVSYMSENPLALNDAALKAGVTIIPHCGLAPGISNILVGHAASKLDKVSSIHIMVGGLPEKPLPPLDYVITWSPESLIDMYTRKARIVQDGKLVDVDALSGLEKIEFPECGVLEAFYTDGLRTLPHTITNVNNIWEKTLRYPGHAEKIELLKTLGFFDEKEVSVDGIQLSPRKLTVRLLKEKLRRGETRDIVVMKVEVSGVRDNNNIRYVYHLFDRYVDTPGVTAMARTTAYPASIVSQLIPEEFVKEKGVIPPEMLGMNKKFSQRFLDELEKRQVKIKENKISE